MAHEGPTVFIVDDDAAVRQSLQWLVESVQLRAEAFPSAKAFLSAYRPDSSGCVVVDLRMPGMSGLELQAELAARNETIPVIMITAFAEARSAVAAIRQGAVDFIEKPFSEQLLLDCIQGAIARDQRCREEWRRAREVEVRLKELTPREREIMNRMVDGQPNKVIASELGLSIKTVEVHRSRVLQKLGAGSVVELVRRVLTAQGPMMRSRGGSSRQ